MRVYHLITIDVESNRIIEANYYEYDGPVELCRGENQKAWNKSQIAKSNAGLQAAGGYGQAAGQERGYLTNQFEGIAANPMSAGERAGRLSSVGGAFDSLGEKANERMARTGNSAGYSSLLDDLARSKAQAVGTANSQLDQEAFNRKMQALSGVGGIYGTDVGAQTHLLTPGSPVQEPSFWDKFFLTLAGNAKQAASGLAEG